MKENQTKVPAAFWIISIIGLLFYIGRGIQFIEDYNIWLNTPDIMNVVIPGWLYVVFAISAATGILGCIGLILRKKWSVSLLLISLIVSTFQLGYGLFVIHAGNELTIPVYIIAFVIIGFAFSLYTYSKRSLSRGWLN